MSKLIMLDAGHGGKDSGACGNGLQEKDVVLDLTLRLGKLLAMKGVNVTYTRNTDIYIEPAKRAELANNANADLFISLHCNAADNTTAHGAETLVYNIQCETAKIARLIQEKLVLETGLTDRGVKARPDLAVLKGTKMPAVLVEFAFISNSSDSTLLKTDYSRNVCVAAVCEAVSGYYGLTENASTPIIAAPSAAASQAKEWAKGKKATDLFVSLADTFWDIGIKTGVNPVVIYCQSAKETGYGKFGGVLDETYCNPCGLKNTEGGSDTDKNAHKRFNSWREGIQAQTDHIALYAGAAGYPKSDTPDPRHFPYLLGTAKTVESLSGKWAPSASYGEDIVRMMKELQNTAVPEQPAEGVPDWQQAAFKKLVESGKIKTPEYWSGRLADTVTIGEVFAVLANL